jgi:glycerate-2-kinase
MLKLNECDLLYLHQYNIFTVLSIQNPVNPRQTAIEILLKGIEQVNPVHLISQSVSVAGNLLKINNKTIDLSPIKNIFVIGFGKASASMAASIEQILGSRISGGHIVTKQGHSVPLQYIGITEAGHPTPDKAGVEGTKLISSIVDSADNDDLVICLISGGGSALLTDIPDGCSLIDLIKLNDCLLKAGTDIKELNAVRKHLSAVKGGWLAKRAFPAQIVSLILSDVTGDPLDVIASGPTVADTTTYNDALSVLRKYNVESQIPSCLIDILKAGLSGKRPETPKADDPVFRNTFNIIAGNNKMALEAAARSASSMGYDYRIITDQLTGNLTEVSSEIFKTVMEIKNRPMKRKTCLLYGGETTVKVTADTGLGGRNQHLALLFARLLKDRAGITFLSGGTDGTDGPTNAAGAVADNMTMKNAKLLEIDIDDYIKRFDSYNFFKQEGGLIKTGPTLTNVMDIIVVLIDN